MPPIVSCPCVPGRIFVFGSNRQGIHGSGSALHAVRFHGAVQGKGEGLQGRSYAIPTKLSPHVALPRGFFDVNLAVGRFILYAYLHPELEFEVVKIGCGSARYNESDIKPLFILAPTNCWLPEGWR